MSHDQRTDRRLLAVLAVGGLALAGCGGDSPTTTSSPIAAAPTTTTSAAITTTVAVIEPTAVVELVEGGIVASDIGTDGVVRVDFMADEDCVDLFGAQQAGCEPGPRLLQITAHPMPGVFHLLAADGGETYVSSEVTATQFASYLAGATPTGEFAIARDPETNRFLIEFDPTSPGLEDGGVGELLALRIIQVG